MGCIDTWWGSRELMHLGRSSEEVVSKRNLFGLLKLQERATLLYPKELFNSLSILRPIFSFIPSSSQSLINLTMIEYLLHVRYCFEVLRLIRQLQYIDLNEIIKTKLKSDYRANIPHAVYDGQERPDVLGKKKKPNTVRLNVFLSNFPLQM